MKILLLSPYDAASHASWRTGLCQQLPQFDWTCLTLPARFFTWRIRGNSLTWGLEQRQLLEQDYDLLLATSMTDLATLRGLVPALARLPTLLYFHENQFAYPKTAHQHSSVEPQMVSLYSALCADGLIFNSQYNRGTFLQGLADLLRRLPDGVPSGVVDLLTVKSRVLPVPVHGSGLPSSQRSIAPPVQVVWNHRWEYDKGPEQLLAALQQLPAHLPLQVHVIGQRFRSEPAEFPRIKALLSERGWLGDWGYLADEVAYAQRLADSHLVLSTAHHDFQGLAVLEAVAAGCVPLVPDRLAYPEWFGPAYRYADPSELVAKLTGWVDACVSGRIYAPDVSTWSWSNLGPQYAALFTEFGNRGG